MRKWSMLFLFIISIFSLTACRHIEDLNGPDDYTCSTIVSDEDILNYHKVNKLGALEKSYYQDNKHVREIKIKKFSGAEKIYSSKSDCINFTVTNHVRSGNLMLVIISDNQIIEKIPANSTKKISLSNPTKKNYSLKMVGESAEVEITIIEN